MALPTDSIANRYQLRSRLASGSYAETWLAIDRALDRNVAIKLVHPTEGETHLETEQFLREARIAASVSHPNVVAVFDGGATGNQPYVVMEWVDGESLKELILSQDHVDISQTIVVVVQLLNGLTSIHRAGIIHRDIKPQNIMVSDSGTVKLTDFGIARLITDPQSEPDGMTAGSAAYMAPEQAKGLPVTPAADIYATGVILYEMLTGRLPFTGTDPRDVMKQHISERVTRPRRLNPQIPHDLESIVMKALSKDPEDRYQSAIEMRDALVLALRKLPEPQQFLQGVEQDGRSRFILMAASIVLAMIVLAGATALAVRDAATSQSVADNTAEPTPTVSLTESVETDEPPVNAIPSWVESTRQANAERLELDENSDLDIRGEVELNPQGQSEEREYVNRQAPIAEVTEEDEDDPASVATGGTTDPAAYVAPTPTPTPQPEPDPDERDHTEGEGPPGEEGAADPPADNNQPEPEPPGHDDDTGTGQGENPGQPDGAGNGESPGNDADDEAPTSNQQSPDDEAGEDDPPANGQEYDDGQTEPGSESPQESDDPKNPDEEEETENLEFTTANTSRPFEQS